MEVGQSGKTGSYIIGCDFEQGRCAFAGHKVRESGRSQGSAFSEYADSAMAILRLGISFVLDIVDRWRVLFYVTTCGSLTGEAGLCPLTVQRCTSGIPRPKESEAVCSSTSRYSICTVVLWRGKCHMSHTTHGQSLTSCKKGKREQRARTVLRTRV